MQINNNNKYDCWENWEILTSIYLISRGDVLKINASDVKCI